METTCGYVELKTADITNPPVILVDYIYNPIITNFKSVKHVLT